MSTASRPAFPDERRPGFRWDVNLHELLTQSPAPRPVLVPPEKGGGKTLPEPVFPQRPELLTADDNYEEELERANAGKRRWPAWLVHGVLKQAARGFQGVTGSFS